MSALSPLQLTDEQRACVDSSSDRPLLVKGIPGSGKTTVLVARAARLMREASMFEDPATPRVRIFTFNRSLAEYVRALAAQLGETPPIVDTFHGWALASLRTFPDVSRQVVGDLDCLPALRAAVDSARARGDTPNVARLGMEFWESEIRWMKGRLLLNLEGYLASDRAGRGSMARLTADDRRVVFRALREYQIRLASLGIYDFDDLPIALLRRRDQLPPEFRAEHVLIDEAQDLQPAAIAAIRASANRSITIAADKGQNIYRTRFRWSEIGIDVTGRSRTLKKSYRTTRAIAELARCLQRHDAALAAEEPVDVQVTYATDVGPKPVVLRAPDYMTKRRALRELVVETVRKEPTAVVAVLHRAREPLREIRSFLKVPTRVLHLGNLDFISPGVVLSTIHSAKGLEFDYVIVIDVDEDVLPYRRELHDPDDPDSGIALARRLLFVAMTRARRELVLIAGPSPSPFLSELDRSLYEERLYARALETEPSRRC